HNLGIVAEMCDRVAVIYAGSIIESGPVESVFNRPSHPYTQGLFGSLPDIDSKVDRLQPIEGMMPDPLHLPAGCAFSPRCPHALAGCNRQHPGLLELEKNHFVACFLAKGGKS
ncbi:MAG TPA: ABC transporter ATP-binding protein, partial [Firmicutes bacterium]|nr:ABC transporter ATP-binding protein [Bacillota bacterium]